MPAVIERLKTVSFHAVYGNKAKGRSVRKQTDNGPIGKPNSTPSSFGSSALIIAVSSAMVLSLLQLQGVVLGRARKISRNNAIDSPIDKPVNDRHLLTVRNCT